MWWRVACLLLGGLLVVGIAYAPPSQPLSVRTLDPERIEQLFSRFSSEHRALAEHVAALDEDVRLVLDIRRTVIQDSERIRHLEQILAEHREAGKDQPADIAVLRREVDAMRSVGVWVLCGVVSLLATITGFFVKWLAHSRAIRAALAENLAAAHRATGAESGNAGE